MDLRKNHGKVFPNCRDSFCYLFEVKVSEFYISFKLSVNIILFDTVKQ